MSGERILIAAVSGRGLAQSARRAGFEPTVLDLFNDDDLEATTCANVRAKRSLRFNARKLLSVSNELGAGMPLVYGAGFEACPHTLRKLAEGRKLCGNTADTLARVNDAERFFALLDELRIPHPEVSLTPPRSPGAWLAKKSGAAGGWHIHEEIRTKKGYYFQRRVSGRSLSALFLASGKEARILGFNETRTLKLPGKPFCYAGAISGVVIPTATGSAISDMVGNLVQALRLVGLNGMDFMLEGEEINVLEINARPPATFELYDEDFSHGLFAAHIGACAGTLPIGDSLAKTVRASAVVYADSPLRITSRVRWPNYACDIPRLGAVIGSGQPICTVRAEGSNFARVDREILARAESVRANLFQRAA